MPSLKLMATGNRLPRRFLTMLVVPALLVMASCGNDDGLGKRYPVSGTVTYNGKPLEKGEISFVSEDLTKNYGATGTITNGSYTLSTGGNEDGAQAGKYKVTIKSKEDFATKAQAAFQKESGKDNPKFPPHLHRQSRSSSQKPDPRRLRRSAHDDPHGRGQGAIQHDRLRALRRQRPARAAKGCDVGQRRGPTRQLRWQRTITLRCSGWSDRLAG